MIYWFQMKWGAKNLFLWALALIGVLTLYSMFYPSMGKGDGLEAFVAQLPEKFVDALGITQVSTGAGWVHTSFFSLLGLFLLSGAMVSWGASAIAGNENSGNLELILNRGISRTRFFFENLLVIFTRLLIFGLVIFGWLQILNGPAELGLEPGNTIAQISSYLSFGALIAVVSLTVGAIFGKKSFAVATGAGLVVGSYILDALGKALEDYEWLRNLSPISWVYREIPLLEGWQWQGIAVIWGLILLLTACGLVFFNRRNISG